MSERQSGVSVPDIVKCRGEYYFGRRTGVGGGIKDGEIQNLPVPRNTQHTAIFSSEILEMRVYIKQIFPFLLHLTKGKVNIN
jgi:hypothetical protein